MAKIDVSATDAARRIALQMLQERGRVCWQPRRIRDVGSSGRIPELMNKQRPLSLAMIRNPSRVYARGRPRQAATQRGPVPHWQRLS
jgi:hypothetical protein